MCRKIFVAATGQNCGKTTISISLVHLARRRYGRVGYMKPIGPKCSSLNGIPMDKDAVLMARLYGMEEWASCLSPLVIPKGSTKRFIDRQASVEEAEQVVLDAAARLEAECDFMVIEGAGHGGVGSVIGLNNARVARLLNAPVVMVAGGGIGNVIDSVALNRGIYDNGGASLRAVLVNKLIPERRHSSLSYLEKAFAGSGIRVLGAFDHSPTLANPTLHAIASVFDAELKGDQRFRSRIAHHIQLGSASSQKVIDNLLESTLLVTTSSRDELIVTASSLYHMPDYRAKLAGLVIPGHADISPISQRILDESGIPYVRVRQTTADVFTTLLDHVSKITAEDTEKIELLHSSAEQYLDFDAIDALL